MARGQNFENASIHEINAAIDVTATKIRELRSNKHNMAEIALEVKQLVTLRRLLKAKSENGEAAVNETSTNQEPVKDAVVVVEESPKFELKTESTPAPQPEALSPKPVESPQAVVAEKQVSVKAQESDDSAKKVADLEAKLAKSEELLSVQTNKATSLMEELNRQVQKYDIEITTSNNMQQRLQNDMKKLVQDKLEFERTLKAAKDSHAEILAATKTSLEATQAELAKESQSFFMLKAAETEAQKQVSELKEQLAETTTKLASIESELNKFRDQHREQEALLQQAKRDLERERVRFEMELDAEKKLQARAHQDARRYSLERQTSVDQLKATSSEIEKLQFSLNETLESKKSLEVSVVRLEAERETSQTLLKTLAKDCQDLKSEVDELVKAKQSWGNERTDLLARVEEHNETKEKLAELQAHNDSLQSSIDEATTASNDLEDKIAELHSTQERLAAEKDELLHHVTKSEQDKIHLAKIQDENDALQRAINELSAASDAKHSKLDALKHELSILSAEKAALLHHTAANESHEASIAQLTLENTQLRSSLSEKSASSAAMAKAVQVAEAKLLDTQYLMTEEMLKVGALEKQIAKLTQELAESTTKHKASLDSKASEAKKALTDLEVARSQLSQLQRAAEKAANSQTSKDDEAKSAKATVATLRVQLAEAKSAASTAEQSLKTIQTELKITSKADKEETSRLRKENGKLADTISQLRKESSELAGSKDALQSLQSQRTALIILLLALLVALTTSKFL